MNTKMIRQIIAVIVVSALSVLYAGAQSRSLAFLETPTDARSAGMGGFSLMSTDRSYLYVNPSSIFDTNKKLTISANGLLYPKYDGVDGRLMNASASAGWHFLKRHVVYVGYRYQGGLSYKSVIDQFGTTGKSTSPFDMAVDMGYAFKLNNMFSLFATGGFIQTYTGRTAYGATFSVGGNFMTPISMGNCDSKLNVALRVADFGAPVYFTSKEGYSLPTKGEVTADLATKFRNNHQLSVALGARYYMMPADAQLFQGNIGAEYTYKGIASLRTGYQLGGKNTSFWSCGLGVQFMGAKLDFAYLLGSKEANNNRMMLTLSFDY